MLLNSAKAVRFRKKYFFGAEHRKCLFWRIMNNADLIQQLASLNWITRGNLEEHKDLYVAITAARLLEEGYHRITKDKELEQLRAVTILKIADFVKKNPRASEPQLVEAVKKEIDAFAAAVKAL